MLSQPSVRRVVVSGNGAAYYVAHALWLVALEHPAPPVDVIAVPGGLLAKGAFRWREGDVLLAISSSGEFRDVIEAVEADDAPPLVTVTAAPGATIGRAAAARAVTSVPEQRALTHTQVFCGAVLAALAIWSRVADDDGLAAELEEAPAAAQRAVDLARAWGRDTLGELATPTAAIAFGTGPAWAAALEAALMVKEVARIPCEGAETREGATAAMTALAPGHLVLSLRTRDDALISEAEGICRSLGATVLPVPGGLEAGRRLAPITTLPALAALAAELALRQGYDADRPAWADAYYATARRA